MTRRTLTLGASILAVAGAATLVGASVPEGLEITLLTDTLVQPKGIDTAHYRAGIGPAGDSLFVVESGTNQVVRIDRETGYVEMFTPDTLGIFPVGVSCYGGPFGKSMYVGNAMGGGIVRIGLDGTPEPFALTELDIAGMDFGHGAFGQDLYAGQWAAGNIWRIDRLGNATLFATIPDCQTRYMKFSHGGAFGTYLYVTDYQAGDVYRVDAEGQVELFASIGTECLEGLEFGPGGAFGKDLYVGDVCSGQIYRVQADGTVELWADGFAGVADITFYPGAKKGFTMYIVDGHDSVYAISHE